MDPFGEAAGNDIGVKVGAAGVAAGVMIGGVTAEDGNLIAGNNGPGIEQTGGTGALNVLRNVFGESPDREESLPNVPTNARLAGAGNGHDTLVVGNHFGAATYGLELTGPLACVSDNFFTPEVGAYGEAAVVVQKDATSARIGNTVGCVSGFVRTNHFLYTSAGKPAVLIRGADDVRVLSNFFGVSGLLPAPLAGPAVRIEDSGADVSNGGLIGSDDDAFWNAMWRSSGPAVQLAGGATGITIAGNEGIAFGDFGSATSLFADLLSVPGLGNSASGGQNGGIQPPAIGVATEAGVAGTGTPGAVVRILQQWRDDDPNDGVSEPYPQGYTLPTTPGAAIVARRRHVLAGLLRPPAEGPEADGLADDRQRLLGVRRDPHRDHGARPAGREDHRRSRRHDGRDERDVQLQHADAGRLARVRRRRR